MSGYMSFNISCVYIIEPKLNVSKRFWVRLLIHTLFLGPPIWNQFKFSKEKTGPIAIRNCTDIRPSLSLKSSRGLLEGTKYLFYIVAVPYCRNILTCLISRVTYLRTKIKYIQKILNLLSYVRPHFLPPPIWNQLKFSRRKTDPMSFSKTLQIGNLNLCKNRAIRTPQLSSSL